MNKTSACARRRGARVSVQCKGCFKIFDALAIKMRIGKGKFCSFSCYQEYRHKHRVIKTDADQKRRNVLYQKKNKYGLNEAEYLALFEKQQNKCAICGISFSETKAHVDHCHVNNKVRGLLCRHCNTAIGMVKDDPDIIRNMLQYLAHPPGQS